MNHGGYGCIFRIFISLQLLTVAFSSSKEFVDDGSGFRQRTSSSSSSSNSSSGGDGSSGKWPKIEWFYIPAGLGFALIGFIQLKHILRREQKQRNFGSIKTDDEDTTIRHSPTGFVLSKWQVCFI